MRSARCSCGPCSPHTFQVSTRTVVSISGPYGSAQSMPVLSRCVRRGPAHLPSHAPFLSRYAVICPEGEASRYLADQSEIQRVGWWFIPVCGGLPRGRGESLPG